MSNHLTRIHSRLVIFKLNLASAIILEQDLVDYSSNGEKQFISKKTISYQPIKCRFGRFGTTSAIYLNRTYIKCITPKIEDVYLSKFRIQI